MQERLRIKNTIHFSFKAYKYAGAHLNSIHFSFEHTNMQGCVRRSESIHFSFEGYIQICRGCGECNTLNHKFKSTIPSDKMSYL